MLCSVYNVAQLTKNYTNLLKLFDIDQIKNLPIMFNGLGWSWPSTILPVSSIVVLVNSARSPKVKGTNRRETIASKEGNTPTRNHKLEGSGFEAQS